MPEKSLVTCDTGLGTTYERWALTRSLHTLQGEFALHTVLEGPGDGMTGICGLNSLPLGMRGAEVTLWLPEAASQAGVAHQVWETHAPNARVHIHTHALTFPFPYPDSAFDLVWNFNVMPYLAAPQEVLSEMARCSARFVLVFVPNRRNYGFPLRRLHHKVTGTPWEYGDTRLMQPRIWKQMFAQAGLRIQRIFHVDCPWWPDIINPAALLGDLLPPLKNRLRSASPEQRARWEAESLPYYNPRAYPDVHRQMQRLAFFEGLPFALQIPFAHHIGILGQKLP
ncbi:MAG: methyltransferase domain-containing protein [Anaerolineae bacterium]|nr:MAG: methyltransferase domain-containing protein [Anaerolineae bacterium]